MKGEGISAFMGTERASVLSLDEDEIADIIQSALSCGRPPGEYKVLFRTSDLSSIDEVVYEWRTTTK